MFEKIKSLFKKKKKVQQVVHPAFNNQKAPLEVAKEAIFKEKQKQWDEKAKEIGELCKKTLDESLHSYFSTFSSKIEDNEFAYKQLNKAWKEYARKTNGSSRYINIKDNCFEIEVARIVKANPQFQQTKIEN